MENSEPILNDLHCSTNYINLTIGVGDDSSYTSIAGYCINNLEIDISPNIQNVTLYFSQLEIHNKIKISHISNLTIELSGELYLNNVDFINIENVEIINKGKVTNLVLNNTLSPSLKLSDIDHISFYNDITACNGLEVNGAKKIDAKNLKHIFSKYVDIEASEQVLNGTFIGCTNKITEKINIKTDKDLKLLKGSKVIGDVVSISTKKSTDIEGLIVGNEHLYIDGCEISNSYSIKSENLKLVLNKCDNPTITNNGLIIISNITAIVTDFGGKIDLNKDSRLESEVLIIQGFDRFNCFACTIVIKGNSKIGVKYLGLKSEISYEDKTEAIGGLYSSKMTSKNECYQPTFTSKRCYFIVKRSSGSNFLASHIPHYMKVASMIVGGDIELNSEHLHLYSAHFVVDGKLSTVNGIDSINIEAASGYRRLEFASLHVVKEKRKSADNYAYPIETMYFYYIDPFTDGEFDRYSIALNNGLITHNEYTNCKGINAASCPIYSAPYQVIRDINLNSVFYAKALHNFVVKNITIGSENVSNPTSNNLAFIQSNAGALSSEQYKALEYSNNNPTFRSIKAEIKDLTTSDSTTSDSTRIGIFKGYRLGAELALNLNNTQYHIYDTNQLEELLKKALPGSNSITLIWSIVDYDLDVRQNVNDTQIIKQLFECIGLESSVVVLTNERIMQDLLNDIILASVGKLKDLSQANLLQNLVNNTCKIKSKLQKAGAVAGDPLSTSQKELFDSPGIWPFWLYNCPGGFDRCISFELALNEASIKGMLPNGATINSDDHIILDDTKLKLGVNGNIISGKSIQAKLDNVQIHGKVISQDILFNVTHSFVNLGIIDGENVAIFAENVIDIGRISGAKDLILDSTRELIIAGIVASKGNLSVSALEQITIVSIKEVFSTVTRDIHAIAERVAHTANMIAEGKLKIESGKDFVDIGAKIIGGNIIITSKGKVIVAPMQIYSEITNWSSNFYESQKSIKYILPVIVSTNSSLYLNNSTKDANSTLTIEGKSGILLKGVDINTNSTKLIAPNGDIKIEDVQEYKSIVHNYSKRGGGIRGFFGGRNIHNEKMESIQSVGTKIHSKEVIFETPNNIEIGVDIIAHSIAFNRDGATKDSTVSLIPKISQYSYEVKSKKTEVLFSFSESGHLMVAGSITKSSGTTTTHVIPTVIQIGGFSDDAPNFILYSKGKFISHSSKIEESVETDGIRKSAIIIETDDIELDSIPDTKFDFAILDETGLGIGFDANSKEVAVKAGIFQHTQERSSSKIEHKNPPSFLSKFLRLKAKSIKDVAAVYDAEQMDLHAEISFHGVAKNEVTESRINSLKEAGGKLGIKLGALGGIIDGAKNMMWQDFSTPEGSINGGFAAFATYHSALKLLSEKGGGGGGAWAFAHYTMEKIEGKTTREIPTRIKTDDLNIDVESWELIGTQIESYRAYIKTKELKVKEAQSKRKISFHSQSFDVEIPITGTTLPAFGGGFENSNTDESIVMNAKIHIHENLRLEVSGYANIRGLSLSARSLEAFFDSLILESVQDILKHEELGMGISFSGIDMPSLSAKVGNSNTHIVKQLTSILGEEKCNIVVAHALHLNGAMIANASRSKSGEYTDHGKLTLTVGEMFVGHIYNYDNGITLGAAISKMSISPIFGAHDSDGHTYATIGMGSVECAEGACGIDDANRDVTASQKWTKYYDIKPITAYIPLEDLVDLPRVDNDLNGEIDWHKIGGNLEEQLREAFAPIYNLVAGVLPKISEETLLKKIDEEIDKLEVKDGEGKEGKSGDGGKDEENVKQEEVKKVVKEIVKEIKEDAIKKGIKGPIKIKKQSKNIAQDQQNDERIEDPAITIAAELAYKVLELIREHPEEFEMGMCVLNYGADVVKGAFAGAGAGPLGAAIGAGLGLAKAAQAEAVGYVVAKAIDAEGNIKSGINKLSTKMQKRYSFLETNKADALATVMIIGATVATLNVGSKTLGKITKKAIDNTKDKWKSFTKHLDEKHYIDKFVKEEVRNLDLYEESAIKGGIGHTKERHVGASKEKLTVQLSNQGRKDAQASTYPDEATAKRAINDVKRIKAQEIKEWYENPKSKETERFFVNDLGRETGYGMSKQNPNISPRYGAQIVLKKMPDGSVQLLTSYPK